MILLHQLSFCLTIRMDAMMDAAYMIIVRAITKTAREAGERRAAARAEEPVCGPRKKSRIARKPATGMYMNTRPRMEPRR